MNIAMDRARGRWLATGASVLALAVCSVGAQAQDDADEEQPPIATANANGESIYITGSRIRTDGMQAPVPITVVDADEVEALSPGALISGVSQLPQFYGSQTPNSGAFFTRSSYGSLNLRGLGVNRTLTLLNGRRMPSTSAFGGVDINLFPEAALATVETTTGGASAAYGSDAVAGVVNFILNTDFTGLELSVQGGITDRGDGENVELSATYGTPFAGGRGHLLVSGEYYNQEGIFNYDDRDWYEGWGSYGGGTEANPFIFAPNMISNNATLDGLISAPGTAINGWRFGPDGSVGPGVTGSISQGAVGTPGARMAGTGFTPGGAYSDNNEEIASLYPDLDRYSIFGYADFELTPELTVFAQYLHGKTHIFQYNDPRAAFGVPQTAITIFSGNPFLPANLQAAMTANNIASFSLRRVGSIEDIGQMYLDDTTEQDVATVGFNYEVPGDGLFGGWALDGYYQYGNSLRTWKQLGLRVDRIFAAVDAVRDAQGNIVCNVSTTAAGRDAFPGCEPVNLFGRGGGGSPTPGGYDYVVGFEPGQPISTTLFYPSTGLATEPFSYVTDPEKVNLTTFSQHFAELAFAGDVIDLWGAGPISAAVGGSYRHDEIFQRVEDVTNPTSNHVSGRPVRCNDPTINLRGVNGGDCNNTVGNQFSKVSNIRGTAEVWEAFGELLVPLVDSRAFSAVANGAVRWANYEGSGTIWAYKGGLEIGIVENQFRLRGTYSRDVRAANLSERFDRTGGFANVTDPRNLTDNDPANDATLYGVTTASGGNPNVLPEEADTWTIGAVFQPNFFPGFSASVDYYNIEIAGAISTVGTQSVVNRCFQDQAQEFCDLITLTSGTASPTSTTSLVGSIVGDLYVNVAAANVEGIDAELSYRSDVDIFGGAPENLGVRVLASWLLERSDTNSSGVVNDFAGSVGALPYADFKATASLNYRYGAFSGLVQARYTDDGFQNSCGEPGYCGTQVFYQDNTVPSVTYVDLRFGYEFELMGADLEVSANVSNLFDVDPPITPSYIGLAEHSQQYNSSLYDVLGRRYTLRLRLRM